MARKPNPTKARLDSALQANHALCKELQYFAQLFDRLAKESKLLAKRCRSTIVACHQMSGEE